MDSIPLRKGTKKEIVYEILNKERKPLNLKMIAEIGKINYNTVRGSVLDLCKKGLIERRGKGSYEVKR